MCVPASFSVSITKGILLNHILLHSKNFWLTEGAQKYSCALSTEMFISDSGSECKQRSKNQATAALIYQRLNKAQVVAIRGKGKKIKK